MDSSNETSYSLAQKLGCSSSYIRKIMFKSRHGTKVKNPGTEVKKSVGRPKSLDAESLAVLQSASINRYINRQRPPIMLNNNRHSHQCLHDD